jgi:hypothetical protein
MMLQEVTPIRGQMHPENALPSTLAPSVAHMYPPHGGLHGPWGTTWDHAIEICTLDDLCTDDDALCRNVYDVELQVAAPTLHIPPFTPPFTP